MRLVVLAVVALLAGCERQPVAQPCATTTRLMLTIRVASATEIARSGEGEDGKRVGFTGTLPNGEVVIVVPEFKFQDQHDVLNTWGHELAHIACGQWHS